MLSVVTRAVGSDRISGVWLTFGCSSATVSSTIFDGYTVRWMVGNPPVASSTARARGPSRTSRRCACLRTARGEPGAAEAPIHSAEPIKAGGSVAASASPWCELARLSVADTG